LRTRRTVTLLGAIAIAASALSAATTSALPVAAKDSPLMRAAKGQLQAARIPVTVRSAGSRAATQTYRLAPFFSGALLDTAKSALSPGGLDSAGDTGAPSTGSGAPGPIRPATAGNGSSGGDGGTLGLSARTLGCSLRNTVGTSVRVNQDCTYRRQAEEDITYNPVNPTNLTGGSNDSRVGYNQCSIDYSINNGRTWGDMLPPFRQRLNSPELNGPNTIAGDPGTFKTYDFASDPAPAIDSQGRAYFSCVMLDLDLIATGLYVTQSPQGAQGSFYYNVPATGRRFIVAEDNNTLVNHDKNMITADRYAKLPNGQVNPNRDNVYVTWTVFKFGACNGGTLPDNPGYCESPIYGSMSTDNALHWSKPEIISGNVPGLCFLSNFFINGTQTGTDCNFDQGSYPVVNPDGSLAVTFNNGNTAATNPNSQTLGIRCTPTGSTVPTTANPFGTAHLNCAPPTKVGDDVVVGEPLCNFGRGPEECIPGPYIRTNDYPRITKDNTQNGHLYSVWQDYRNGEFDIQMSQSLDGGATWHEVGTVNPDRGLDHYMPATDQAPVSRSDDRSNEGNGSGERNGVSYYRSERVPAENVLPAGGFAPCGAAQGGNGTKCEAGVGATNSDYVVAGGSGDQTPYNFTVVSPVFPPPDGAQTGFNGDYSGMTVNRGIEAHPIWSDTRNANPFPLNGVIRDEDIFTTAVNLPSGQGEAQAGVIGSNEGHQGGGDTQNH
jgi:hypothetical protein